MHIVRFLGLQKFRFNRSRSIEMEVLFFFVGLGEIYVSLDVTAPFEVLVLEETDSIVVMLLV